MAISVTVMLTISSASVKPCSREIVCTWVARFYEYAEMKVVSTYLRGTGIVAFWYVIVTVTERSWHGAADGPALHPTGSFKTFRIVIVRVYCVRTFVMSSAVPRI
jgi:hypothetical protein